MQLKWDVNKQMGFLDITPREYGLEYFKKYERYSNTEQGKLITDYRINFVSKWYQGAMLDVGVGCGQFVKARKNTFGYDISLPAVEMLKGLGLFRELLDSSFKAYSFFDSFEHIKDHSFLNRLEPKTLIFISIPIFQDIGHALRSKHFRPDEHCWYFTAQGLIRYMADYGFSCLDVDNFEIRAGREDIWSFVFEKR